MIETPRLRLRPWTLGDADAWHAIWGDPEVIFWGANKDRATSDAQLTRLIEGHANWPAGIGWVAVETRPEGDAPTEVIGDVLLQPGRSFDGIELGWHMRRSAWGKGYAPEAARAWVESRFAANICDEVSALILPDNHASIRVAEKLGMTRREELMHADLLHVRYVWRSV